MEGGLMNNLQKNSHIVDQVLADDRIYAIFGAIFFLGCPF